MKKNYLLLFVLCVLLIAVLSSCKPKTEEANTFTVGLECNYAPFNWTLDADR